MAEWFSIEVLDGTYSAAGWAEAFGDALVTEALSGGATNWDWHRHSWGTVFEVEFADDAAWDRFRQSLAAQTALDAVPDPVSGLIIYRGRGGSAGGREPRRPRPLIGSGSAALPLPLDVEQFAVFPTTPRRLLASGS
ncbi:MAG TPA: hypothetical protein VGI06_11205 [Acidimicrobiales bacterium]